MTEEQIEQCRKEFEAWASDVFSFESDGAGGYYIEYTQCAWEGFKSAWRPAPTVEQIEEVFDRAYAQDIENGSGISTIAQLRGIEALHAAFGGKK